MSGLLEKMWVFLWVVFMKLVINMGIIFSLVY